MEILIAYSHRGYKDSQKNSSDAKVLSQPYNGAKLSFMSGHFSRYLGTIKRTVELPNFSFREIKSTEKYEIFFGKYEGITFPSEEILSIVGFTGIPDGRELHIGYKIGIVTSNKLMKI